MDYKIFLYIILGILPSLVWLSFYLKKDSNPEPKAMILKIFLWGALVTIPVFFVQISLAMLLTKINVDPFVSSLIYWFLVIAFTEEIFKFLVVKFKVLNSHHLDEPVDIVIYMIVAALGFAGLENILYLFSPIEQSSFNVVMGNALLITFIRFIGATFLHTLCSAIVGYALAISFCDQKNRFLEVSTGIILATLLHGVYNFSIITLDGYLKIIIPAVVIFTLAVLVFSGFEKLKKIKSVTILN
jgi:RsiW-degrading membrane proteinase PrsW (M82 family)